MKKYIMLFALLLAATSARAQTTQVTAKFSYDDGTAVAGQQAFTFWRGYPDASKISGWDQTIGPSGGCGFNKWLNVRMPFTLTPVG